MLFLDIWGYDGNYNATYTLIDLLSHNHKLPKSVFSVFYEKKINFWQILPKKFKNVIKYNIIPVNL